MLIHILSKNDNSLQEGKKRRNTVYIFTYLTQPIDFNALAPYTIIIWLTSLFKIWEILGKDG